MTTRTTKRWGGGGREESSKYMMGFRVKLLSSVALMTWLREDMELVLPTQGMKTYMLGSCEGNGSDRTNSDVSSYSV